MADVLTLPLRAIVAATPRTRILRLDLRDSPLAFHAGQAALIGLHGHHPRRPYSIASSPEDAKRYGRLEFLVKVDATGYPGPHLTGMTRGSKIDFEGPFGAFTLPSSTELSQMAVPASGGTDAAAADGNANRNGARAAHDAGAGLGSAPGAGGAQGAGGAYADAAARHAPGYLFVAGGTGISPLRSMLRQLLAEPPHPPISVLYSARAPEEFAYGAELRRFARRGLIRTTFTVTGDAGPSWLGGRGRIDTAQLTQALPSHDALCFVCGPQSLVDEVPALLWQIGVPTSHVRTEEW